MDRIINENAVLSAIGEWIAHNEHTYTNATEYLRNRVKAIKTAEQEPCDCISRDAVQNYVESHIQEINTGYGDLNNHTNRILRMIVDGIGNMPSVQPKPKTGHWIIKEGREQGYDIAGIKTWYIQIMCDKCGFIKTAIEGHTGQYHFCPNCGAKMESPQNLKYADNDTMMPTT